ncbi:hypothetical protein OIE67_00815 [Nonomuraea fuscirosea]|jgi:hypothetical protein|uniref:hypothetical protein n=1 Tax=Nonomuraea fuscirosea TaxID=1291556 RepID=UPI002DDBA0DD|nr:hypothetical protein [Nonomuraea fuscirosea]WSA53212.1 hypothetical protein OIE67_00815 [Nonomuraea fuscirosea]
MMRVLVPARLRKAVRTWFDSRYISISDHRQDIRDALWEVQTLRREMVTLQSEVERLRQARPAAPPPPPQQSAADKAKIDDARRLAQETAKALDGVLQNEILVWQAIDELRAAQAEAQEKQTAAVQAAVDRSAVVQAPMDQSAVDQSAVDASAVDVSVVAKVAAGRSRGEQGRAEEQPCA